MPKTDTTAVSPYDKTKELTDKLEEGMKDLFSGDKYRAYLETMSQFHNYSARNVMLIKMQMPQATRIASYNNWRDKFNRQVKKGEKGLKIFAPIGAKAETVMMEKLDKETGAPMLDKDGNIILEEMTALSNIRFKLVSVFDIDQTYGEPLPEIVEDLTGDVAQYEAFLDALKEISPLPIEFEPLPPAQDGYCRFGDKIGIREGMSEVQTISAIVHEIAHARLHDVGKGADIAEPTQKAKSKKVAEIEAESVAFVVCAKYKIETGANSFGYLAEWGSHDMKGIKASLTVIRKEASDLITAIDEQFAAICKERGIDLSPPEQAEQAGQTATEANKDEKFAAAVLEKPKELEIITESTTENIAGVDFTFEEVKAASPAKAQATEAVTAAGEPTGKSNYQKLAEMFPEITGDEYLYLRMEAGEAMMPLSLEWISENKLSVMHTYTQNGDLMYDPMVVMEVDRVTQTAKPIEFEQSNPPIYQRIDEDGIGHSIDGNGNEREINGLQGQLDGFCSQWFDNIGSQGYAPVSAVLRDSKGMDASVFFNSDKKAFSMAFMYDAEGTTVFNHLDKTNPMTEGTVGSMAKIAHVDSYRNITFFEDNLPKGVVVSVKNVKLVNEKTEQEKQTAKKAEIPTEIEQDVPQATPQKPSEPEPEITKEPETPAEPMPDKSIGITEMGTFGYNDDGMLPLRDDRAMELFGKDHAIYLLHGDGTEAMVFDSSEITTHAANGGIFGIEREDWQKSQEYREMGNSTGQQQEAAVESAFLSTKEDSFAIYQIMDGAERVRDYRFEGLDFLKNRGLEVSRAHYVLVHTDVLSAGQETLGDIFQKFNVNTPADFSGRSLSVSDVVVFNKGGEISSHYVDSTGFSALPSFLGVEKQQPIQSADKTINHGTDIGKTQPQTPPQTPQAEQSPAANDKPQGQPPKDQHQETRQTSETQQSTDSSQQTETETPEVPFHEVAVYENTGKQAVEYGDDGTYSLNRYINIECAGAIDKAIKENKTGAHDYDLKAAARSVIATFGKERVTWVLSSIIQHDARENAGATGSNTFSDASKEWGGKAAAPKESPAFGCMTHKAVLNVFIKRIQEVAKVM